MEEDASKKEEGPPSVRRWRNAFLGVYVVFTVLASALTLVSILAVHLGWTQRVVIKGPRIAPSGDKAPELRVCHTRLAELLADLHRKTFELQAKALKFRTDPAVEWRNWSKAWRGRWQTLDYRCRLAELSGTGASVELDRMKTIHGALAELQLSYNDVVTRFVERYAHRLRDLREALDSVRSLIERRATRRRHRLK